MISIAVAGLSTDTGHYSTPNSEKWAGPGDDVSPAECPYLVGIRWSSGNAIVDWTWRTLHLGVLAGKEVTKQYCGRVPGKAYFMDCSTGKHQAIAMAVSALILPFSGQPI